MAPSERFVQNLLAAGIFASSLILWMGFAFAASDLVGTTVGKTTAEIKASLESHGYEVRKIKPEDGLLEAYALKGDKLYEVYVDTSTGTVTKVKEED